jgi:hypothetical protein
MTPKLTLLMTPDKIGNHVVITLFASVPDHSGQDRHVPLYSQVRCAQPLHKDQSIEQWAVESVRDHYEGMMGALESLIAQGAITLMAEAQEPRLFLCLGTWPGPSRPAMIDPVPQLTRRGTGSFLWFQPRSCE